MDGKVAIITGATSGIGEATARQFAQAGARVALIGRRADRGKALEVELSEQGADALYIQADMTSADDIERMVATTLERWGRLDYAFNNAGMFGPEAAFHEYDDDVWDQWMDLNLKGVYRCMKFELRAMLETVQQLGTTACIVNNASIMGHRGSSYAGAAYATTKHGVIGLTRQAAIEYVQQNIRVNSVSPGPTVTEITAATAALPAEAKQQVIDDLLPIGRMGEADEVAAAVLFLCSDGASMVTGHDMPVDGGQLIKL